MRQSTGMLALTAMVAMACGGKAPPAAPPPPLAPAIPVAAPMPEPEPTPVLSEYDRVKAMSVEEIARAGLFVDVPFDYDRDDIRPDAEAILRRNAEVLRTFDFLVVTIEGHCDEGGTVDYNLALGDRRAGRAHTHVASLGVPAGRLRTASYGKESPLCFEADEGCWQRNRRAHFAVTEKLD